MIEQIRAFMSALERRKFNTKSETNMGVTYYFATRTCLVQDARFSVSMPVNYTVQIACQPSTGQIGAGFYSRANAMSCTPLMEVCTLDGLNNILKCVDQYCK